MQGLGFRGHPKVAPDLCRSLKHLAQDLIGGLEVKNSMLLGVMFFCFKLWVSGWGLLKLGAGLQKLSGPSRVFTRQEVLSRPDGANLERFPFLSSPSVISASSGASGFFRALYCWSDSTVAVTFNEMAVKGGSTAGPERCRRTWQQGAGPVSTTGVCNQVLL